MMIQTGMMMGTQLTMSKARVKAKRGSGNLTKR
jgi:hypothetical protein